MIETYSDQVFTLASRSSHRTIDVNLAPGQTTSRAQRVDEGKMKHTTESSVEPDFLRITVTGEYDFDEMYGLINNISSEAARTERDRVLIDCSTIKEEMTEVERFKGGQMIAEIFGSRLKAALVMPHITKLGEIAAVNRGARFLVTTSKDEAVAWLMMY